MRSVLFSLAAIISFANAAEDRVCLRTPSLGPCRNRGPDGLRACPQEDLPLTPFKHDGPCPLGSRKLNEISQTDDKKWRSCTRLCRDRNGCGLPSFDWKGPCPAGYNGVETRPRVCKKKRCQGGAKKCTTARTGRCRRGEKKISPKDNPEKRLRHCRIKDCQIKPSRYCSKSCSLRRCRVKVRGYCPQNTNTLRKRLEKAGRSNGRTNGNDYEAGLLGIAIGNDYGAVDNGGNDYEGDDYEVSDYEADDYEVDDYDADDYEADDYKADDYKTDDYKADDYEDDSYEDDDYEDYDYEVNGNIEK